MQRVRLYISGLVFILFSGVNAECKNARRHSVGSGSQHQAGMNARDSLLGAWRKDSLGCLHIRNYELSTVLEKKYDLTHKGVDEIMTILGKPNKTIRENKELVLRFYCNTCCDHGKLKEECDYSWVDFTFPDSAVNRCIITGGVM